MNIEDLLIDEETEIREAIKRLDETGRKILVVIKKKKLVGTITDGDIRRWILKNGDFKNPVSIIMSKNPKYIYIDQIENGKKILKEKKVEAMPIVNHKKEVLDIVFWNDDIGKKHIKNKMNLPVVIMAGGKGSRLEPYTKILPKPLIPIGDIPIVERIINRFEEYGCQNFYMTVNHKKNMIRSYFEDVKKTYTIEYIEEDKPLGTAGSLYLLKDKIKDTFILTNCDILIEADYFDIVKYHKEQGAKITLVSSLKNYTIPYGVIEIGQDENLKSIIEKPNYDFLVNTGMYILEADVVKDVPEDVFFHITDLIEEYIKKEDKIAIYPVSEGAWLDMGQFKEMEIMLERLGLKDEK